MQCLIICGDRVTGGSRRIVSSKAITVASGWDKKEGRKKAKLRRPYSLRRRVRRGPFLASRRRGRGAERRQALGAERRTRGPPRGRADLRFSAGDQPANDAGRRASRRSTAASFRTRAALSRAAFAVLISRLSAGGP